MSRGFGQRFRRVLCLLAVFGPLAAVTSGCDSGDAKKDGAAETVPPALKQSNNNMENFMKTQKAKK